MYQTSHTQKPHCLLIGDFKVFHLGDKPSKFIKIESYLTSYHHHLNIEGLLETNISPKVKDTKYHSRVMYVYIDYVGICITRLRKSNSLSYESKWIINSVDLMLVSIVSTYHDAAYVTPYKPKVHFVT